MIKEMELIIEGESEKDFKRRLAKHLKKVEKERKNRIFGLTRKQINEIFQTISMITIILLGYIIARTFMEFMVRG